MSELIEALARRLCTLDHRDWDSPYPDHAKLKRYAAEVVRQMEWARRNCAQMNVVEYIGPTTEFPNTRGVKVEGWVPLTLAPDGWTP